MGRGGGGVLLEKKANGEEDRRVGVTGKGGWWGDGVLKRAGREGERDANEGG